MKNKTITTYRKDALRTCPYNVEVQCACTIDCNCYLCGWHPDCHARRVKVLRSLAKYGVLRKKVKQNV